MNKVFPPTTIEEATTTNLQDAIGWAIFALESAELSRWEKDALVRAIANFRAEINRRQNAAFDA
jgi:hypothetical protein